MSRYKFRFSVLLESSEDIDTLAQVVRNTPRMSIPRIESLTDSDLEDEGEAPQRRTTPVRAAPRPSSNGRSSRFVDGKQDKGIRGEDLVLLLLSKGERHMKEITQEFVARRFAPNSASPRVADLVNKGVVHLVRPSVYALTKKKKEDDNE